MTCEHFQEIILENLDGGAPPAHSDSVIAHLAVCGDCARFDAVQRSLDRSLAEALPVPRLSDQFAPALKKKIRAERLPWLWNSLPDWIHLGSGTLTTLIAAWALPAPFAIGLGLGLTATTWAVQMAVGALLEEADGP